MKNQEILFKKYESLAKNYASSLHQVNIIGYEPEDILQEFRIKLYQTILAYSESDTVTPIVIYIKSALSNFKNDFLRKMKRTNEVFCYNTMVESCDFGVSVNEFNDVDTDANNYVISGVDITSPLKGLPRAAFILHIKGATINEVKKVYVKHVPDIEFIIKKQKDFLKKNIKTLQPESITEYLTKQYFEE